MPTCILLYVFLTDGDVFPNEHRILMVNDVRNVNTLMLPPNIVTEQYIDFFIHGSKKACHTQLMPSKIVCSSNGLMYASTTACIYQNAETNNA